MFRNRLLLFVLLSLSFSALYAGVTTYQFTDISWSSRVGATACDGKTDGWVSDKDGYEYLTGRTDANGLLYSQGVSVKTGTSGAGATSVNAFTAVRQVTFNFCQNASKGRGTIYLEIGGTLVDSIVVVKPATSGSGVYLRDSVIRLSEPRTGKIRFYITCTENAINLNSITIRAEEGGTNPFTSATYQLVTSVSQLCDSDQIIIGVQREATNYIMGYFDETVSQNNIHAIRGRYTADRTMVDEDEDAIYTLRRGTTHSGEDAWYIQDELRYEEAYLVASGGQTKNRLALWDKLYDEKTYGDYGYWDISVEQDGTATIRNLGKSKGIYLQYNAVNDPTLFACYATLSQTPVCIYRRVEAVGNVPAIVAPMVNFSEMLLEHGQTLQGERRILVNAHMLTEDIQVSLAQGEVFSLSASTLDREGDYLTIRYHVTTPGKYVDTLRLVSGDVVEEVSVMLRAIEPMSIAEVVTEEDFTTVFLGDVVVTKKYDTYVFIRDDSGSMMIYDAGDGTGHRYASGLKAGDVLRGVTGKYRNYFGVPELTPSKAWNVVGTEAAAPEVVSEIDSSDVCRFVRLENVRLDIDGMLDLDGQQIEVVDAFNTGIITLQTTNVDAIVYISWDELQLWLVDQSIPSGLEQTQTQKPGPLYNVMGQPVDETYRGVVIQRGGNKLLQCGQPEGGARYLSD